MVDKLLTYQKLITSYTQEKEKILGQISKQMKILQNQIDHYNYVTNTQPSQDFLSKFENVQTIILEKIDKRIELEMKDFVQVKTQYANLFNDFKSSTHSFISDLKKEAMTLCDSSVTMKKDIENPNLSRGRSKRRSSGVLNIDPTDNTQNRSQIISIDGLYVLTEILQEILVLENMNMIQLINVNNYHVVKAFTLDGFKEANAKFKTVDQLLKCFCECPSSLCIPR
uniref:Uncharacterized protein n=1 Tax=Cacopsylla melanoneura TaxID=428564 RepID=A0A8D9ED60_9HEMI